MKLVPKIYQHFFSLIFLALLIGLTCASDDNLFIKIDQSYKSFNYDEVIDSLDVVATDVDEAVLMTLSTYTVTFTVVDTAAVVIEGATVTLAGYTEQTTNASGVAVVIEAQHLCMMMRGVQKQNSVMTTSSMTGIFRKDPKTRSEFLSLIDHN